MLRSTVGVMIESSESGLLSLTLMEKGRGCVFEQNTHAKRVMMDPAFRSYSVACTYKSVSERWVVSKAHKPSLVDRLVHTSTNTETEQKQNKSTRPIPASHVS